MIQEINSKFRKLWRASPGTIYPLLNRLTEKGFLTIEEIIRNNRDLKIYRITDEGKRQLQEVLKVNLGPSMNTLGDYIRTIVQTWVPNEDSINEVMSCFPFHCRPRMREIDEEDITLGNIKRINRIIQDLSFSRDRLSRRLNKIDEQLISLQDLIEKMQEKRKKEMKTIEIKDDIDDEEWDKSFD